MTTPEADLPSIEDLSNEDAVLDGDQINVNEDNKSEKESDISPASDGSLLKEVIRAGEGWQTPKDGEEVKVHYVGSLLDGTVFDSSRDRNERFSFIVGKNQVIQGWEIAIKTMKRGEVANFTIAPNLAYGEMGSPPTIPPNANLRFEIELFDWKLEDLTKNKDGGVCKRIATSGTGYDTPNVGSICDVRIVGRYKDRVFDDRSVKFIIGESSEANVIEGIDIAVRRMKQGETSEVVIKPQYAFGEVAKDEYQIPSDYDELVYEVTLNKFEKAKEIYEMDENEKLEQSQLAKDKGTNYFKELKYPLAIRQYKRIVKIFGPMTQFPNDEYKSKRDQLLLAAYLNLTLCYLKMNDYDEALKNSDLAIKLDESNAKALFRKGLANFGLKNYSEARDDFNAVLKVEPSNKVASNQIILCNDAIRKQYEREKNMYSKMFATTQSNKPNVKNASEATANKQSNELPQSDSNTTTAETTTNGDSTQ